ncbi:MOSC domain-containing protein [Nocardioides sp.]|uniref:MOSC domain-containing protein n=1 Tax=Nocardioides sp. TaxID=35761 RepID=UPI002B274A27|nr:MOSC N-terminal beta barrel domain-containing protein [Nocardioides sp.]
MAMTLSALRRYPIKSCRGEALDDAVVEPWGLAGDRRWMIVDDTGTALTARTVNAMLLLRPEVTETGLRLHTPGDHGRPSAPMDVVVPDPAVQVPVRVGASFITAVPTGPEVASWICQVLGTNARLVWLDDPQRRPTDQRYSEADDRVSFADGFPLLLTSEGSLADLNEAVAGAAPLAMTRFRPNVVISGAEAWAEDDWRRIRIGEATFRAVKACERCVMTTVDPETAERGREPLATLARTRRWDGKTWFGVNLIPDVTDPSGADAPRIAVGDEVEVLESVPPGEGPLRTPIHVH